MKSLIFTLILSLFCQNIVLAEDIIPAFFSETLFDKLAPVSQIQVYSISEFKKVSSGIETASVEFDDGERFAAGRAVRIDPKRIELEVLYTPEAPGYDFSRFAQTPELAQQYGKEYKEFPGQTVRQFMAHSANSDVLFAVNGHQGNFWNPNTLLIVDGKIVVKTAAGIMQDEYEPLSGTYSCFILDKGAVGVKTIHLVDGVCEENISYIKYAIAGPLLIYDNDYVYDRVVQNLQCSDGHEVTWGPDKDTFAFSAIGVDSDGKIIQVTMAGDPNKRPEMLLAEIAEVMKKEGCKNAILLGGSIDAQQCVLQDEHPFVIAEPRQGSITAEHYKKIGGRPVSSMIVGTRGKGGKHNLQEETDHLMREIIDHKDKTNAKVIAITGRSGSGKTEIVGSYLQERGFVVMEADEFNRNLPEDLCRELIDVFGPEIIKNGNCINNLVAFREGNYLRHEEIIALYRRKYVLTSIRNALRANTPFVFVDCAYLGRLGVDDILDNIWHIEATEETRRRRLFARDEVKGVPRAETEEAMGMLKHATLQDSGVDSIVPTDVIDNNGTIEGSREQIDGLLSEMVLQRSLADLLEELSLGKMDAMLADVNVNNPNEVKRALVDNVGDVLEGFLSTLRAKADRQIDQNTFDNMRNHYICLFVSLVQVHYGVRYTNQEEKQQQLLRLCEGVESKSFERVYARLRVVYNGDYYWWVTNILLHDVAKFQDPASHEFESVTVIQKYALLEVVNDWLIKIDQKQLDEREMRLFLIATKYHGHIGMIGSGQYNPYILAEVETDPEVVRLIEDGSVSKKEAIGMILYNLAFFSCLDTASSTQKTIYDRGFLRMSIFELYFSIIDTCLERMEEGDNLGVILELMSSEFVFVKIAIGLSMYDANVMRHFGTDGSLPDRYSFYINKFKQVLEPVGDDPRIVPPEESEVWQTIQKFMATEQTMGFVDFFTRIAWMNKEGTSVNGMYKIGDDAKVNENVLKYMKLMTNVRNSDHFEGSSFRRFVVYSSPGVWLNRDSKQIEVIHQVLKTADRFSHLVAVPGTNRFHLADADGRRIGSSYVEVDETNNLLVFVAHEVLMVEGDPFGSSL